MSSEKTISVIIPCYNSEARLPLCLDSISKQNYDNLDIICIDDGSTDDTHAILERYSSVMQINVIKNEKRMGPMYSRLQGLIQCKGEYISFIDSDDYVSTDYYKEISSYGDADLVLSRIFIVNDTEIKEYSGSQDFNLSNGDLILNFFKSIGGDFSLYVCWGKLYKRSLFDSVISKINEYPQLYMCEDILLTIEVIPDIKTVSFSGKSIYFYCKNHNSITVANYDYKMLKKLISDLCYVMRQLKFFEKRVLIGSNYYRGWYSTFLEIWLYKIYNGNQSLLNKLILEMIIVIRLGILHY
jgi:glycosyltransferase involved in cell wall biosynthesis